MKHGAVILLHAHEQNKDGSLNNQTADRCDKAINVFKKRNDAVIYITVSNEKSGKMIAFEMKNYLIKIGISKESIKVFPEAFNTIGEIKVALKYMEGDEKIISVSSFYHLPRIFIMWLLKGKLVVVKASYRGIYLKDLMLEPLKMVYFLYNYFFAFKKA